MQYTIDTINAAPKISGIYQILCIPTCKVYIGSAANINLRWNGHKNHLIRRTHHSKYLQSAWQKYGSDQFVFSVLEFTDKAQLIEREQYYFDLVKPYERHNGYNVLSNARSSIGRLTSDETREKQRQSKIGKSSPYTAKARLARSLSQKGKPLPVSTRLAQVENASKQWIAINSAGIEQPVKNLAKFCRENNLDKATAVRVAQGKNRQHKGWVFKYLEAT
jgi:group I intron endonuclease